MRLSHWLERHDISHGAFARLVGNVTTEAVRLWVAGARMPETRHVLRIVAVTDGAVTAHDLHETRAERLPAIKPKNKSKASTRKRARTP